MCLVYISRVSHNTWFTCTGALALYSDIQGSENHFILSMINVWNVFVNNLWYFAYFQAKIFQLVPMRKTVSIVGIKWKLSKLKTQLCYSWTGFDWLAHKGVGWFWKGAKRVPVFVTLFASSSRFSCCLLVLVVIVVVIVVVVVLFLTLPWQQSGLRSYEGIPQTLVPCFKKVDAKLYWMRVYQIWRHVRHAFFWLAW